LVRDGPAGKSDRVAECRIQCGQDGVVAGRNRGLCTKRRGSRRRKEEKKRKEEFKEY